MTDRLAWIFASHVCISVVSWWQLIFSMNRYRGAANFRPLELWALFLFGVRACIYWVASVAADTGPFSLQLVASGLATFLSWEAFVIVYNQRWGLPSWQQLLAVVLSTIIAGTWELITLLTTQQTSCNPQR